MNSKLALLLMVTLAGGLYGGNNDSLNTTLLKKGSKALQFEINNLLNLSPFSGSTISLQTYSSNKNATRYALSIRHNLQNLDGDQSNNMWNADTFMYERNENLEEINAQTTVSVSLLKIKYKTTSTGLLTFWGIGPGILFHYAESSERKTVPADSTYYNRINRLFIYSLSVTGTTGIEWFFRKNMSLHSEYSTNFQLGKKYTYGKKKSDNGQQRRTTTENKNGIRSMIGSQVKFGVSLFF